MCIHLCFRTVLIQGPVELSEKAVKECFSPKTLKPSAVQSVYSIPDGTLVVFSKEDGKVTRRSIYVTVYRSVGLSRLSFTLQARQSERHFFND